MSKYYNFTMVTNNISGPYVSNIEHSTQLHQTQPMKPIVLTIIIISMDFVVDRNLTFHSLGENENAILVFMKLRPWLLLK